MFYKYTDGMRQLIEATKNENISGILNCVIFFVLAYLLVRWSEGYEVIDHRSILLDSLVFLVVMIVGDIANEVSHKNILTDDGAGWARVALFLKLSVLPPLVEHLFDGDDSSRIYSCIIRSLDFYPSDVLGNRLVLLLVAIGLLSTLATAFTQRAYKLNNTSEYSSISAFVSSFVSSFVAVLLLSVYLFVNHLNDNLPKCDGPSLDVRGMLFGFSALGLYVAGMMVSARHFTVYIFNPVLNRASSGGLRAFSHLIYFFVFILLLEIAIFYWDLPIDINYPLIVCMLLLIYAVFKLVSMLIHGWKYYPYVLLVLLLSVLAMGVGYLTGVYLQERRDMRLKKSSIGSADN